MDAVLIICMTRWHQLSAGTLGHAGGGDIVASKLVIMQSVAQSTILNSTMFARMSLAYVDHAHDSPQLSLSACSGLPGSFKGDATVMAVSLEMSMPRNLISCFHAKEHCQNAQYLVM